MPLSNDNEVFNFDPDRILGEIAAVYGHRVKHVSRPDINGRLYCGSEYIGKARWTGRKWDCGCINYDGSLNPL